MISEFFRNLITMVEETKPKITLSGESIPCYNVTFTRKITNCPFCNAVDFIDNGNSTHDVYAIINDKPAFCTLIRTTYKCNNEAEIKYFHNTYGNEDRYFVRKRNCMPEFIRHVLRLWLMEKDISFTAIGEKYGISYGSIYSWAESLKNEFDRHFVFEAETRMIFSSFKDKTGVLRGFVGSPGTNPDIFNLIAFVDDYSSAGISSFFKRVKKTKKVSEIYIYGDQCIRDDLQKEFEAPVFVLKEENANVVPVGKVRSVTRDIVERVNNKDAYESIVLKFLYDTKISKAEIRKKLFEAVQTTGTKHASINTMGFAFVYDKSASYSTSDEELLRNFTELPFVSGLTVQY